MESYFKNRDMTRFIDGYTDSGRSLTGLQIIASGDPEKAADYTSGNAFKEAVEEFAFDDYSAELTYFISNAMYYGQALTCRVVTRDALTLLVKYIDAQKNDRSPLTDQLARMLKDYTELVQEAYKKQEGTYPVKRAKQYIGENLRSRIRVGDIAEYCKCSISSLQHTFKKENGMTLKAYIRKAKIREACELMKNRDMNSLQTSLLLGYCSQSHFIEDFKRETGMTPGTFLKQVQ